MKYRRIINEIEAIQWTGDNYPEIREAFRNRVVLDGDQLFIDRLGVHYQACLNNFIYEEDGGRLSHLQSYNFLGRYEPVEEKNHEDKST